jgi:hypothetical protein
MGQKPEDYDVEPIIREPSIQTLCNAMMVSGVQPPTSTALRTQETSMSVVEYIILYITLEQLHIYHSHTTWQPSSRPARLDLQDRRRCSKTTLQGCPPTVPDSTIPNVGIAFHTETPVSSSATPKQPEKLPLHPGGRFSGLDMSMQLPLDLSRVASDATS